MKRSPRDFVNAVQQQFIDDGEHIAILYAISLGLGGDPRRIWPEMQDVEFREQVLQLYPSGRFSPPDQNDDWTFVAYKHDEESVA